MKATIHHTDGVVAFASLSMPKESLKKLVTDVTSVGGAVVFRGFKDGNYMEMAKAVAQGVAMAMSMNSGNKNPQYIMNSIILDGSEIAKAVTKAQSDTDSRFKPSPAY